MKRSRETIIGTVIIIAAVIFLAAGYIVLPDILVVQIGADGQPSNTLPKIPALLIPFAISTIFSIFYMKAEPERRLHNLFAAIVGIVAAIAMFLFNYR